ncbi:hypothetical protein D918_03684 [Trichuris suis]|nr:hypothetical protein D918_03684 [Trichuris suis]
MCFQLQDKKGKVLLNGEHLTWRELRKALPEVFAVYGLIGVRLNSLYFTVIQRNQLAAFLFRYRRLPMVGNQACFTSCSILLLKNEAFKLRCVCQRLCA